MTKFVDQLKLAERAKEDVYFARLDRELIAALRRHKRRTIGEKNGGEVRERPSGPALRPEDH